MNGATDDHGAIYDDKGVAIYSTVPEECRTCVKVTAESEATTNCGLPGKRRRGTIKSRFGSAFLCTPNKDLVASSRRFKQELQVLIGALPKLLDARTQLSNAETSKTKRLLHNLVSLNAHALQDAHEIASPEALAGAGRYKSQLKLVGERIQADPAGAARFVLSSLRNAAATKNEINVFRKLGDLSPDLSPTWHSIHRVVRNVAGYFLHDFSEADLSLHIAETYARVRVDYESIHVALYHLLENAAKYAKEGSEIRVVFLASQTHFRIRIEMVSLFLAEDEWERVFEEKYSGSQARVLKKAGDGLGMGLIRELARLNGASFDCTWGSVLSETTGVLPARWAKNELSLSIPLSRVDMRANEKPTRL